MPTPRNPHLLLLGRSFRLLRREPVQIPIMFIQPLVWLLLYSQLFRELPRLGGFGTDSYMEFLAPGVAVLTAFSHGAWEGTSVVQDLERGAVERFLVSPLPSSAVLVSRVLQASLIGTLQALVIILVALVAGAEVDGGVVGMLVILVAAALVCATFTGLSHALALVFRKQQTMIAVGQFAVLPFMFLSTTLTSASQMPAWMQAVASLNPVNWAVEACRSAMLDADTEVIAIRLIQLAAGAVVTGCLALIALRRYRLSL